MALLARKTDRGGQSTERAALAAAIAERDRVRAEQHAAAANASWEASIPARHRLEAAEAAFEAAKRGRTLRMVDSILGRPNDGRLTLEAAASELADAKADYEAMVSARAIFQGISDDKDYVVLAADRAVRDATKAVIAAEAKPHAGKLAERLLRLQDELAAVADELDWLRPREVLPVQEFGSMAGYYVDDRVRGALGRVKIQRNLYNDSQNWFELIRGRAPSEKWDAALAALERDASAPLPVHD